MGCRFFSDCNKCNEAAKAIKEDCQAQTEVEQLKHELEKAKMDERIVRAELHKWLLKYEALTKQGE